MCSGTFLTFLSNRYGFLSAFELSLNEGNRFEKRLFHATFATVSCSIIQIKDCCFKRNSNDWTYCFLNRRTEKKA